MPNANGTLDGVKDYSGKPLSIVQSPAETILLGENDCDWALSPFAHSDSNNLISVSGALSTRHSGGSNIGFCDGHVKWMTYTQATSTQNDVPYYYWKANKL